MHFALHRPPRPAQWLASRGYALSRFPNRPTATSRFRHRPPVTFPRSRPREQESSEKPGPTSPHELAKYPDDGMKRLLLGNDTLVIERQIEMLNIFMGFEQANRYSISNKDGEPLGFIAEESRSFLSIMARQAFATHRPFKATIMDTKGSPIMWLRRPFAWINSRMYVQRLKGSMEQTTEGEPILDTLGEVQQVWHPWRRRYDLFIREGSERILSTATEAQPEPDASIFAQFARIDSPFLAWEFRLFDAQAREIAYISRAFRGFGREIFTDTGQYSVRFGPSDEVLATGQIDSYRTLTLDERALVLALAINIDFDYFSRHSGAGGVGFFHISGGE